MIQQDDIAILKKDAQFFLTKEASIERDIFAGETRRLQKMIRQLQVVYHEVCSKNNEVVCLRENIAKLQTKIIKIEMNINNSKSIIKQMKKDIAQAKLVSIEVKKNTKNAINRARELETHSTVLQNMLIHKKEEVIQIQKQTSTLGEQIRIVKKTNSDRVVQATLATRMLASNAKKSVGKGRKYGGIKMGKLKKDEPNDSTLETSPDLCAVRSSSSSPATPSSQATTRDFDNTQANYIKATRKATNTFVETAAGSGSLGTKPYPDSRSATTDSSQYEQSQKTSQKDVSDAENIFMDMMDEMVYGAAQPRKDLEAEAKRVREPVEALQKQQREQQKDINKWLNDLTIELDNKMLKIGEYVINVTDSKINVKITSPDKTPEALARKKAKEEAQKQREAEEAARRASEEEARRKKSIEEEAAQQVAKEEARKKKEAEEAAWQAAEEDAARRATKEEAQKKREAEEEEATRKKIIEEDAARRATEEEARKMRGAEQEARKKKIIEEEATRQATEEEARKKRKAEQEEAKKKKIGEEDATRQATEAEARKKRLVEEAARLAVEEEEEAGRKKSIGEEAARQAAEEEAKQKREAADDEVARQKTEFEAEGDATSKRKAPVDEFFTNEMQGTIKENIMEVLSHLEVISASVQQKASSSGTAESTAKDVLRKLDEPLDQLK